jgi:hypothetical protein
MGALENSAAPSIRAIMVANSKRPFATRSKCLTNQSSIMIEVPLARIPEEPGEVIPHALICKVASGN